MSFGDATDLESGRDQLDDDRAFRLSTDAISRSIFSMASNTAQIQRLSATLGTNRDNAALRAKLHSLTEDTRMMIRQTVFDIKKLSSPSTIQNKQRLNAQSKLGRDMEDVLKRFQAVSKVVAENERSLLEQVKAQDDDDDDVNAPLMARSSGKSAQIQLLDNEIEYNDAIIAEREEDLKQIETSILEVNEIFRDLGTIVHEQQYMLDNIESNVVSVASNVETANVELRTASRYQKLARNKMCWLLLIVAITAAVIILTLTL
ncbi:t-SNARE [Gonapodya prolifera JEL478]|uniref:t-SNARE n=1 Tax=Gonapodya prolifera (strain JEL478) TaxID=1344416 RepID=A0A139A1Q6_GONPJ|nr:t-SNARE [Gonapodya prolifera JEL478]|eukprot:KXS10681.1 t-SNARE [Gonapodya prolifera JEL478]